MDAIADELRALGFNQEIEAHALDEFHDDEGLVGDGHAVLKCLDEVLVAERHANDAFGGPVTPQEARFELEGLFLVENLEADDAPEFVVASPRDLGHAALAGLAEEFEAFANIDFGLRTPL